MALGILDFDRATKTSVRAFAILTGAGARLERALIQFMLDIHTKEHGYTEVLPPFMVSSEAPLLRRVASQVREAISSRCARAISYLIPTAEVPLTNLHRDEILEPPTFPAATPPTLHAFAARRAPTGRTPPADPPASVRQGRAGQDHLSGELVRRARLLTANAETILKRLGLPDRVVVLATGDMGNASAKTFDIEVWLPSQGTDPARLAPAATAPISRPGAQDCVPARSGSQAAPLSYFERLRPRGGTNVARDPGELPERGWIGDDSGGVEIVHGRVVSDPWSVITVHRWRDGRVV